MEGVRDEDDEVTHAEQWCVCLCLCVCVLGGEGRCNQECFSHAHAVVYHAASTVLSAPDHAPRLSPIGRRVTHLCVPLDEALGHALLFPPCLKP